MKKLFAVSATALIMGATLAVPVSAAPTGPDSIRPGKNIGVFHNLDFVAAFGYEEDKNLTVDVYRGPHKIATASGPAVEVDEGLPLSGALEVNHGPEGAPAPGDCWTGYTPDIIPGDRIVVTDSAGLTDQVFVDDITISGEPREDLSTADPSDIIVEGRAAFVDADGIRTPIPIERLDSGELRLGSDFRANPNTVERTPGTTDGWTATYKLDENGQYKAFKGQNLPFEEQKQAILDGDHAMGYGHVAPLPPETQLVEGLGGGGPALGCEQAPKQANAVTISDDPAINLASGSLNLSGTAMEMVESVSVTLSDEDPATADVTVPATGLTNGLGEKAWSAEFTREQIDGLPDNLTDGLADGEITAAGTYTLADGPTTGATKTIQKDTVAPASATATPGSGVYNSDQSVSLNAEAGATIRYTTNGADPTVDTGQVYNGQINVSSNQTIKAIVVDGKGNPSPVATFDYTIDNVAPSLGSSLNSGSFNGPQTLAFNTNDAGAKIHYTTNGDVPEAGDTEYTGPITVSKSQSFKAVAIDQAGNPSRVLDRNIVIRTASRTSLNVASTDLKLGKSRVIRGAVGPAQVGGKVKLIIRKPGVDVVRNVRLVDSRYSFTYKPPVAGRYSVQVSFAQDVDNLASKSVLKSFRVIR